MSALARLSARLRARAPAPPAARALSSLARGAAPLGFVFDIDGVLLRGKSPLPRARATLARLDAAGVPYIFLTNGGGEPEAAKAAALAALLGVRVDARQVVLSHTPMRPLCAALGGAKVLVLGCRDVRGVAAAYGLTHALTAADVHADDAAAYPFLPPPPPRARAAAAAAAAAPWAAVLVLHDPNSWGLEIQVALDVLRGGARGGAQAVPLYCSNGDLTFAGAHAVPRLAAGAFTVALKATWAATVARAPPLEATFFGKPSAATFAYAEGALRAWAAARAGAAGAAPPFARIVMVGDNPAADVRGANAAGGAWTSVLVRSGLWSGGANDADDPAALVVDGVGEAVDAFLA